jgi:hypothetical protein
VNEGGSRPTLTAPPRLSWAMPLVLSCPEAVPGSGLLAFGKPPIPHQSCGPRTPGQWAMPSALSAPEKKEAPGALTSPRKLSETESAGLAGCLGQRRPSSAWTSSSSASVTTLVTHPVIPSECPLCAQGHTGDLATVLEAPRTAEKVQEGDHCSSWCSPRAMVTSLPLVLPPRNPTEETTSEGHRGHSVSSKATSFTHFPLAPVLSGSWQHANPSCHSRVTCCVSRLGHAGQTPPERPAVGGTTGMGSCCELLLSCVSLPTPQCPGPPAPAHFSDLPRRPPAHQYTHTF